MNLFIKECKKEEAVKKETLLENSKTNNIKIVDKDVE